MTTALFSDGTPKDSGDALVYSYRALDRVGVVPHLGLNHWLNPLPPSVSRVIVGRDFPIDKLGYAGGGLIRRFAALDLEVEDHVRVQANDLPSLLTAYEAHRDELVVNAVRGEILRGLASAERVVLAQTDGRHDIPKRLSARRLLDGLDLALNGVRDAAIADADLDDWDEVKRDQYGARFITHLRSWQTYLVARAAHKGAVVVNALEDLGCLGGAGIIEHAGNSGSVAFHIAADPRTAFERLDVTDIDPACAINHELLRRHFGSAVPPGEFQAVDIHSHVPPRHYSVVLFCHCLLYFERTHLVSILRRSFDSLATGGALVIFENTAPPQGRDSKDGPLLLSPDALLTTVEEATQKEPRIFDSVTGRRASRERIDVAGCLIAVER